MLATKCILCKRSRDIINIWKSPGKKGHLEKFYQPSRFIQPDRLITDIRFNVRSRILRTRWLKRHMG